MQRRSGAPGFKASLHVCKKTSGDVYDIRKSFRLKNVTLLEAFDTVNQAHPTCQITFGKQHGMLRGSDSRIAFECPTEDMRAEMLGVVYSFCKSHEHVVPKLVGLTRKDLGLFGEFSDEEEELISGDEEMAVEADPVVVEDECRTPTIAAADKDRDRDARRAVRRSHTDTRGGDTGMERPDHCPTPMTAERFVRRVTTLPGWSDARQKKSMETIRADILLNAISEGANSLEDACATISLELRALDDANTHELLELDHVCTAINNDIYTVLGHLDDIEETVAMFDMKLTHLSDDISTIDESSSYLEHHAVNTAVLLETIDSLIETCTLHPEIEHVLIDNDISTKNLDRIEKAYRKLHSKMEDVETLNVSDNTGGPVAGCGDMKVVQDAIQHMKAVEQTFLKRIVEFYDSQMDATMQPPGKSESFQGSKELFQVHMHEKIAMVAPVLGLIFLADPHLAETRMLKYVDVMNTFLMEDVNASLGAIQRVQQSKDSKSSKVGKELLTKVDSFVAMERVQSQSIQQKHKFHAPSKSFEESFDQKPLIQGEEGEAMKHIQGQDVSNIFQNLLSYLVPRIRNEISVLIDLLHQSGVLIPEISAIRNLVQGVGPLMSQCVMAIRSSRGLGCLDVTASLQHCLLKLPSDSPHISVVHSMLVGVLDDCMTYWRAFCHEIRGAIQRFDSRSGLASSLHILPFIVHFEYIAQKMEAIVAEWVAKDGTLPASLQSPSHHESQESVEEGQDQMATSMMPGALLRKMADEVYQSVLPAIFTAVDAFATQHDKYKERIRLENFSFLRISLQSLPVKSSQMLKQYCNASLEYRNKALNAYVTQIMSNSDLGFLENHDGCSKLCEVFPEGPSFEATLTRMMKKLRKDVGDTSFLIKVVWERVDAKILQCLDKMEASDSKDFEMIQTDFRPILSKFRSDIQ